MKRVILMASAATAVCVCSGAALANPVVFNGSSGGHAASASFDVSGNTVTVVVTNTGADDALVPADVLTAIFFNLTAGSPVFTPVSAIMTNGSTVFYGSDTSVAGNVGGEWAFGSGLTPPAPIGALPFGISSTGLGIFGNPNFNGPNLGGPAAVDGLQWGITSAGDDSTTANGGLAGSQQVHNSVTFTLTFTGDFNPNNIGDVYFLYGTATDEGGFHHPAPGAAALMGLGGLLATRRKRS